MRSEESVKYKGDRRDDANKIIMVTEGDFTDFDRGFYQWNEKRKINFLILFSIKKQLFASLNLDDHQFSTLDLKTEKAYQEVEVYDKKIFCVNKESLTIDIFSLTKKQNAYHKQVIGFANKGLKLSDNFQLIVWKHCEGGVIYRCLLGPLKDGRYMNFELLKRFFDNTINQNQTVGNVVFISMACGTGGEKTGNIICAMDEIKKSVVCYNEEKKIFYEYNGFAEENSKFIDVIPNSEIRQNRIKKIYFYYAYDFFSQKKKNQLMTVARNSGQKEDIDIYAKNSYKEVLICMEKGILLKMVLVKEALLADVYVWKFIKVDLSEVDIIDITINEHTGEIYCLCKQGIYIFQNLNEESIEVDIQEIRWRRGLNDNCNS